MQNQADRHWEQSLAVLDLAPGDLALAEQRLAVAPEEALPASTVEALVARATVVSSRAEAGAVRGRLRAAAILVGSMLFAAFAVWLIWPQGQRSHSSMSYQQVIDLLETPSQPAQDRLSALRLARSRVDEGIKNLQSIRDEPNAPPPVTAAARSALASLRDQLATLEPLAPMLVDDALKLYRQAALNPALGLGLRLDAIAKVAYQTKSGLLAMLRARGFPESDEFFRRRWIEQFRAALDR